MYKLYLLSVFRIFGQLRLTEWTGKERLNFETDFTLCVVEGLSFYLLHHTCLIGDHITSPYFYILRQTCKGR